MANMAMRSATEGTTVCSSQTAPAGGGGAEADFDLLQLLRGGEPAQRRRRRELVGDRLRSAVQVIDGDLNGGALSFRDRARRGEGGGAEEKERQCDRDRSYPVDHERVP